MRRAPCLRYAFVLFPLLLLVCVGSGPVGRWLVPGVLHPANLNPRREKPTDQMLVRTGATKEDFSVRAPDGIELRGWKVRARSPNGNWVLAFHGVSDNRTGVLGAAEILLRHGYNLVMMDSRAYGESGG